MRRYKFRIFFNKNVLLETLFSYRWQSAVDNTTETTANRLKLLSTSGVRDRLFSRERDGLHDENRCSVSYISTNL